MRYLSIYIILFMVHQVLFCQQIPFQGKLLENGTPITGQRSFQFSISTGNINWSETQNNINLSNGLYAVVLGQINPLPSNLFANQLVLPLNIQVNGQTLNPVNLYAPIENDPTIPLNLKDGVSWEEVSNKPALDESTTNELQQLQLNSNQLSITSGNTVDLPIVSDDLNIPNSLSVGSDQPVTETAIEQLISNNQSSQTTIWQSFILTEDSELSIIEVEFANVFSIDVRLKIYTGVGNGTQAIFDQTYLSSNFSSSMSFQSFTIDNTILTSGQSYTFEILGIGNPVFYNINANNPYSAGESSLGASTDLVFKIITQRSTGFYFSTDAAGTTIQGPVTLNDRLKDKTGIFASSRFCNPLCGSYCS